MALTKITSDVIGTGAITSDKLASGAVSASSLSSITTDNVSEGSTNTYFTNARARGSVSVTGGGLSYDSGTGVIQIGSIPNTSLTNSSLTVNSNSVSLGGSVTLDTDDIGEGSTNLYFTNARAQGAISGGTGVTVSSGTISIGQDVATSSTPTFGNITTTGYIAGPATFTIDPAAVGDNTGTVVIAGNLQVDGTTTTINSTTMTVDDLNIQLATGAINAAAANGAGITVDGASATITYDGTNDEWDFNKNIKITGTLATAAQTNITSVGTLSALTVTGEITANGGIALGDNEKATFGNSDDLQIYHLTNTYLENYTGNLNITNNSNDINIQLSTDNGSGGTTSYILINGNTGTVNLSYYGSQKLITSATGIDVTGTATMDGLTVDGAATIEAATGQLRLQGTTNTNKNISLFYNESGDYGQINCDESGVNQKDLWMTGLNLKFGRSTSSESMRIESTGQILITNETPSIKFVDSGDNSAQFIQAYGGYLRYYADDNNILSGSEHSWWIDGSRKMTLDSSGNVGIGTDSPNQLLTVNIPKRNDSETNSLGAAVVAGPISGPPSHDFTNSNCIFRVQGNNATNNIQFGVGNGTYGYNPWIQASYDNSTSSSTDHNAKHLLIHPIGGSVAIGKETYASAKLEVVGSIYSNNEGGSSYSSYGTGASLRAINLSVNQSATHYIEIGGNLPGYNLGQYNCLKTDLVDLHFAAGGVYTGYIGANTGFTDISDEREKENIVTITNATAKLKQLRGVYHTWKDTAVRGTDTQIGLIAQEVEAVVPEVVSISNPTSLNTPESDTDGLKGVAYAKLVPLLIETIKELEARITALES